MNRLLFLFGVVFFSLSLFANNEQAIKKAHKLILDGYLAEADSIYIACLETASDSEKVEIYIKLGEIRLRQHEIPQGKSYLFKAVDNAVDNKQLGKATFVLGLAYLNFETNLDSATMLLDKALLLNEEYYGIYQSNLAFYYKEIGEYELAVAINDKAIHYFITHPCTDTSKVSDDSLFIYRCYYTKGQAYKEYDRIKALGSFLKAAEYLTKSNISSVPWVYKRIAEEYRFINDIPNANKYDSLAAAATVVKEQHRNSTVEKEYRDKKATELKSKTRTQRIIAVVLLIIAGIGGRYFMKRKIKKS